MIHLLNPITFTTCKLYRFIKKKNLVIIFTRKNYEVFQYFQRESILHYIFS